MHDGVPYRSIDPDIRDLCRRINGHPRFRTSCSCQGHIPPTRDHQREEAYVAIELRHPTAQDYRFLCGVAGNLTLNGSHIGQAELRVPGHDSHGEDTKSTSADFVAVHCAPDVRIRRVANTAFIHRLDRAFAQYNSDRRSK